MFWGRLQQPPADGASDSHQLTNLLPGTLQALCRIADLILCAHAAAEGTALWVKSPSGAHHRGRALTIATSRGSRSTRGGAIGSLAGLPIALLPIALAAPVAAPTCKRSHLLLEIPLQTWLKGGEGTGTAHQCHASCSRLASSPRLIWPLTEGLPNAQRKCSTLILGGSAIASSTRGGRSIWPPRCWVDPIHPCCCWRRGAPIRCVAALLGIPILHWAALGHCSEQKRLMPLSHVACCMLCQ